MPTALRAWKRRRGRRRSAPITRSAKRPTKICRASADRPSIAASVEADVVSETAPAAGHSRRRATAASVVAMFAAARSGSVRASDDHEVESVGAEDALEEVRNRRKPAPPVQHPGSHQAPADPAGTGRQGRTRQQGCGTDHLPVARRPLFGSDAEHGAWRRHFAQDHQPAGPQAPEGNRRAPSTCRRAWASSCAPPAPTAPRSRSSATTNI